MVDVDLAYLHLLGDIFDQRTDLAPTNTERAVSERVMSKYFGQPYYWASYPSTALVVIEAAVPKKIISISDDDPLTVKAVASRLSTSDKHIYALMKEGKIPFIKIRKSYRIIAGELEEYLQENSNGISLPVEASHTYYIRESSKIMRLCNTITHPGGITNCLPSLLHPRGNAYTAIKRALECGSAVEDIDGIYEIYRRAAEEPNIQCYICGELIPLRERHVDHVIPLLWGGPTTPFNLAIVHAGCNLAKSAQAPEEIAVYDESVVWRARQGYNNEIM